MGTCKQCTHFSECAGDAAIEGFEFNPDFDGQRGCPSYDPFTNADRIRAMTDEELAEFLEGDFGNLMIGTALNWLQQPAEED